jgi:RNA polymerase sigma-70 factor (ECF subfamily)
MPKNPHLARRSPSEGGQNDSTWFKDLYHEFSGPLFKFIAKRVGRNEELIQEVFEETVVAGWRGYNAFEHKSSYLTWLCRIALNKIADYYHDQVNDKSGIIVPIIDAITQADKKTLSPEEALALKELRVKVNDCLNLLPYEKRKLLWYRYWRDYSYEKISKLMGISERAVEGRIYRAKEEFAKVWTNETK